LDCRSDSYRSNKPCLFATVILFRIISEYIQKVGVQQTSSDLAIAKMYSEAKIAWSNVPGRRGKASIGPPPPPKKSCLDKERNSLARTVAQIRCGHWRSAAYFKRIRRRPTDHCWFCNDKNRKMTRSHTLLHCPNERLAEARRQSWGNTPPSGIKALLANPRWESRLLHFLELSGVGRIVQDGSCEDESWGVRMDNWVAWDNRRSREPD
jgi:hypothetical protein